MVLKSPFRFVVRPLVGVAGAAEQAVSMRIAPGEIISLYGMHLGPDPGVPGTLGASGRVTTDLGGYQVLVNGIPAPLLYAGANQINLVIPFSLAGAAESIQVTTPAGTDTVAGLQVDAGRPQIFPAIINQDGTINSPAHPAPRGSIVTMWATGGGAMDSGMVDGEISWPPLGKPLAPVSILLSRLSPADSGQVTYAGAAPGMVAGVIQINFQVPAAHQGYGSCHFSCEVILGLGTTASQKPDLMLSVPD